MKKFIALILAIVFAVCALAGCGAKKDDASADGKIDAKVILVLEDESEKTYDIHVTKGLSLREALFEAGLIDESQQSSYFVENIDGHEALAEEGVLWYICDENSEPLGAIDDVTVENGQTFRIIYTVAPNFDD